MYRVRTDFSANLPLRTFFEAPTVSALSAAIDSQGGAATEDDEVSKLMAELEGLSDEEVERLLAGDD